MIISDITRSISIKVIVAYLKLKGILSLLFKQLHFGTGFLTHEFYFVF